MLERAKPTKKVLDPSKKRDEKREAKARQEPFKIKEPLAPIPIYSIVLDDDEARRQKLKGHVHGEAEPMSGNSRGFERLCRSKPRSRPNNLT